MKTPDKQKPGLQWRRQAPQNPTIITHTDPVTGNFVVEVKEGR